MIHCVSLRKLFETHWDLRLTGEWQTALHLTSGDSRDTRGCASRGRARACPTCWTDGSPRSPLVPRGGAIRLRVSCYRQPETTRGLAHARLARIPHEDSLEADLRKCRAEEFRSRTNSPRASLARAASGLPRLRLPCWQRDYARCSLRLRSRFPSTRFSTDVRYSGFPTGDRAEPAAAWRSGASEPRNPGRPHVRSHRQSVKVHHHVLVADLCHPLVVP